jgi:GT2 family glycosyltransferase
MPDKLISIVIVSFNAREHLRRCLTTLYEHQRGAFEVIVVDNASPDGSAAMVSAEFSKARLIRNSANAGFAVAANIGMREALADVIVLLNPDSELRDDPFSAPVGYLRSHPDAGALGVKLLDPDGALQLSVRRFPGLEVALFNRYSLFTRLFPKNRYSQRYLMTDWGHDSISDVDWVSGACLLTTRAVLDRIGYLDEGYFWGFEDVDFCQRVHRAGLRVVYYPETSVIHAIGASAHTVPTRALIARHQGMWRYYRRYLASNVLIDSMIFAGIWARCGVQLASGWLRHTVHRT